MEEKVFKFRINETGEPIAFIFGRLYLGNNSTGYNCRFYMTPEGLKMSIDEEAIKKGYVIVTRNLYERLGETEVK